MVAPLTAHKLEATVDKDGTLTLRGVPFKAGDRVEVIVWPARGALTESQIAAVQTRLRDSILRDDDPFGPATPLDDWEAPQ